MTNGKVEAWASEPPNFWVNVNTLVLSRWLCFSFCSEGKGWAKKKEEEEEGGDTFSETVRNVLRRVKKLQSHHTIISFPPQYDLWCSHMLPEQHSMSFNFDGFRM